MLKELMPVLSGVSPNTAIARHVISQRHRRRGFNPAPTLFPPTTTHAAQRRDRAALRLAVDRKLSSRLAATASIEESAKAVVDELYPALDYSLASIQEVRGAKLHTLAATGELVDRYAKAFTSELSINRGIGLGPAGPRTGRVQRL